MTMRPTSDRLSRSTVSEGANSFWASQELLHLTEDFTSIHCWSAAARYPRGPCSANRLGRDAVGHYSINDFACSQRLNAIVGALFAGAALRCTTLEIEKTL